MVGPCGEESRKCRRTPDNITLSKSHSNCVTATTLNRTSLKWIQPSVDEHGLTRSIPVTQVNKKRMRGDVDLCNEKMRKKAKLQPLHVVPHSPAGTISVYCDSPSALLSAPTLDASGEKCMCCYHTTLKEQVQEDTKSEEEEAYDLMVKEEVPDSYWKVLAERRRAALEKTLRENKQLHEQVKELNEENGQLSMLATQAEYFASVLSMLTGEKAKYSKRQEERKEEIGEVHTDECMKKDVTNEEVNNKTDYIENETDV